MKTDVTFFKLNGAEDTRIDSPFVPTLYLFRKPESVFTDPPDMVGILKKK